MSNQYSLATKAVQFIIAYQKSFSVADMHEYRAIVQKIIEIMEDSDKMAVLLGGIPDSFETVSTIIENDPKADYKTSKEMIINHARKLMRIIESCGKLLRILSWTWMRMWMRSWTWTCLTDALKHSIASVAQICDAGTIVVFTKNDGKIIQKRDDGKLYEVASFPRVRNLYQLCPNESSSEECVPDENEAISTVSSKDSSDLKKLHIILGHLPGHLLQSNTLLQREIH